MGVLGHVLLGVGVGWALVGPVPATPARDAADLDPVVIDFFFEPGCSDCVRVENEVLPALEYRCGGLYRLRRQDVGQASAVAQLAFYQQRLGIRENEPVCMVIDGREVLNGFPAIRAGLVARVDAAVVARMNGTGPDPSLTAPPEASRESAVRQRFAGFSWAVVAAAGLLDGLNPCAISTLVFFVSVLAVSGVRGRRLMGMGAGFCAASFITYTAIGFGLWRAFHALAWVPMARTWLERGLAVLLLALAARSARDAWRFHLSGDATRLAWRLPRGLSSRVHDLARRGARHGGLLAGGMLTGAAVTILDSVCTGQVYVPALVFMLKAGEAKGTALPMLLVYNLMFVTPLVAVFVLTLLGLRSPALLAWSRRNVVTSRLLAALVFVLLAVLLWRG